MVNAAVVAADSTSAQTGASLKTVACRLDPVLVDVASVLEAIDRVPAPGRPPLRYEEYRRLEALLCGQIRLLVPLARERTGEVLRERLETAIDQLGQGLGDGLRSALHQVQLLAVDCQWLLRVLDLAEPPHGR